jgi:hypothetical protein
MRKKALILMALGCAFAAAPARAQFIGYTSPQTVSKTVFTGQSCVGGVSATVPNIGQVFHTANFAIAGAATTVTASFQGSTDGVNFVKISDDVLRDPGTRVVMYGIGYFPVVKVLVGCTGSGAIVVFGSYVGDASPQIQLPGDYDISVYQKTIFTGAPEGSNSLSVPFQPPYGNALGTIYFSYSTAAVAGSTITITGGPVGSGLGPVTLATLSPANVTTMQTFAVAAANVSTINVFYTSGAAGVGTYALAYLFTKP